MYRRVRFQAPAQGTANGTGTVAGFIVPISGRVTGVHIIPNAAVTFHATNYRTVTLQNRGTNGAGTTAIAAIDTSANSWVATDQIDMTLNATATNRDVTAGQVVALVETVAASGVAHGGYTVEVVIDPTYAVN